jgi:hypothetical protein
VSVTLGLDAPVPESGTATISALTVIDDGIVVGHAFPVGASVPIGPGVGEPQPWTPVTWDAAGPFEPCDPAQPFAPGSYRVVVQMSYVADGGDGLGEPIWSEPVPIDIG